MFGGKVHMCVFVWVCGGIYLDQGRRQAHSPGQVFGSNTRCQWGECHSDIQSIDQEIMFPGE